MVFTRFIQIISIRFLLMLKTKQCVEVSGMLLYAQTDEKILPDNTYMMSGNSISVKTLNLNCAFSEIAFHLNEIADNFMGN